LSKLSNIQAKCLSYYWWELLNLWWVKSLTVQQSEYLSGYKGNVLYLNHLSSVTTSWLSKFLNYKWKIMNISWIKFEKHKKITTHTKKLTLQQLHLISYYKWAHVVVFTKLKSLTDFQKKYLERNKKEWVFSNFNIPTDYAN
jgi:hypothetical protein